jgi:hypothetical protein
MPKEKNAVKDNVILVLKDAKTGKVKSVQTAHNIVTTAGNRYYAQLAAASATSFTFTQMTVSSSIKAVSAGATFGDLVYAADTSAIPTGGTQTVDSGYPTADDKDTDNTGSDSNVVTWLRTYTTSQGNTNVKAVVINQAGAVTGNGGSTNLLVNAVTLAVSQSKTTADILKVFVNHTFVGT